MRGGTAFWIWRLALLLHALLIATTATLLIVAALARSGPNCRRARERHLTLTSPFASIEESFARAQLWETGPF
jgi:predicted membrane protein